MLWLTSHPFLEVTGWVVGGAVRPTVARKESPVQTQAGHRAWPGRETTGDRGVGTSGKCTCWLQQHLGGRSSKGRSQSSHHRAAQQAVEASRTGAAEKGCRPGMLGMAITGDHLSMGVPITKPSWPPGKYLAADT